METEITLKSSSEAAYEESIREALNNCLSKAERARRQADEAIADAVTLGQRMIDAKAHFSGRFDAWLEEKFPETSRQYLNRFKQLAEAVNRGLQLAGHASLRQAFIAAGILPPAQRSEPDKPTGSGACKWLSYLQRTWDEVQKLKPATMTEIDREQLKSRLKPFVEKYAEL